MLSQLKITHNQRKVSFEMSKILFLIALLIVSIFSPMHGGEREGFFVAASLGLGTTYVFSESALGDQKLIKGAPAFTFKFGYAPSQQLQIHGSFTASMFQLDRFRDYSKVAWMVFFPVLLPINIARSSHAMFGLLGTTYYFEPEAPSFMIGGGLGVSSFQNPFWNETVGDFGLLVEGGYEFAKYFSVKLSYMAYG